MQGEEPKLQIERDRVAAENKRVDNEGLRNVSDATIRTRELDIKATQEGKKNESKK